MRCAKLNRYLLLGMLCMLPLTAFVQNNRAVSPRKLFSLLQELNEKRKVYFFLTDASMGDWSVEPVIYSNEDPLPRILDKLLQKTTLTYKLLNAQTVVIYSRSTVPLDVAGAIGDPDNIRDDAGLLLRGRVLGIDSTPLPQATLQAGDGVGALTNAAGFFRISIKQKQTLQVSCVGYEPVDIPLSQINFHEPLIIQLRLKETEMDEVIITGFDVARKMKTLGYPVSVVHTQQINNPGYTNVIAALYGKVPGVRILTAPGGATSAVQMQVRGLNSLNFNSQPIFFLDGIAIRNTNEKGIKGINNGGYWDDPRIRGNGLLDINPQDIESLTILKGASATALYGSEAANGVVLITSKKAMTGQGLRVELNYAGTVESKTSLPRYQKEYGPGYDRISNLADGADENGWIPVDNNGDGVAESMRPNFGSYAQFGPRLDGRMVTWWDGQLRPYQLQRDNYDAFYQTGYSSQANISVSNHSEKGSYRFSYSRHDYRGIQVGGNLQRNTLQVSSQVKISPRISVDWVTYYTHSYVHNRPYQLSRLMASYAGFLSRAEYPDLLLQKYQTSQGYKWVSWTEPQLNPAEAIRYPMKAEALDFLWMQLRNKEDENQDRFINSVTFNYRIASRLRLRARLGNDFTSSRTDVKRFNEYPTAFNVINSTGLYKMQNGRYSILYGDALLSYDLRMGKSWTAALNAGYQARREKYSDQTSSTEGGLLKENWFNLQNSFAVINTTLDRSELLRLAYLAFATISYRNYLFGEVTARQEYSSTLPPGNNHYFYGSANGAYVFTERWNLKKLFHYGKLRVSYGVVGNAPPAYAAALTYVQTTLPTANGPVAAQSVPRDLGNPDIKPERKYETEAGIELQWLKGRLGLDFSWYNSRIRNQIVQLTVPASAGAYSQLINGGVLHSRGFELSLEATPVKKKEFTWQLQINAARNRTQVSELGQHVREVVYYNSEQQAVKVVALPGQNVGEIYVYPQLVNEKGQKIVGANGLYVIDKSRYERVGNIMPRWVGGMSHLLTWKQFTLEQTFDFRLGGEMVSPVVKYNMGAGMYASTMRYRDEKNGGLPYYIDTRGQKVLLPSHNAAAPGGQTVYHDGLILDGVDASGATNHQLVDAASYYMNMFGWGPDALNDKGMVFRNSYIKMREIVLSYSFKPRNANAKGVREIRFSLLARNVFYLWRTLKDLDPETAIGSNWSRQGIDEGTMAANRSIGFAIRVIF